MNAFPCAFLSSVMSSCTKPILRTSLCLSLAFVLGGCASLKRYAVGKVADTLASGGGVYASEEDPELVRQAVPFGLKLMESLLAEAPEHKALLEACSKGFTQYAYAFVQQDAEVLEEQDYAGAERGRVRARKLFLRARNYGLRGLEQVSPGFRQALAADPRAAVEKIGRRDIALLYWTAASWGGAVGLGKDDPALVSEIPQFEALIDRALALEESWNQGSIHSFLITYEMLRQGVQGLPQERARVHYERAVTLSGGRQASPHVSWAESVCVELRDRAGFEAALQKALAIDVTASPENRLENEIFQNRARWLLSRIDDLFL